MQLVSSCARVLQPARCLAALSCGPPAVWAPHLNTPASIATTSDGQNSQSQEGSAVSSSRERGSTQQATGTSRGAVPSAAISPDQDLEQPTAAEAAREEEQFGLNTPAPGKGDNNSSDSSSCPALPLCGLAITEAERGLPDVNKRVLALLGRLGLGDEPITMRMTGCPNGCARPYMAEIGYVGDGPNTYQLWLGGSPNQTRLAKVFAERVKLRDLETVLEPLLAAFKSRRQPSEAFGDFVARVGFAALRSYSDSYVPADKLGKLPMVSIDEDTFKALEAVAAAEGKSIAHVASEKLQKINGQ